jgi:hypothetical protein
MGIYFISSIILNSGTSKGVTDDDDDDDDDDNNDHSYHDEVYILQQKIRSLWSSTCTAITS